MVLVDPAVRGRGIGTRLLDQSLVLLSDMPLVRLDATTAGHPLYLTRGFAEEGQINRLQGIAPDLAQARPEGVRPMSSQDIGDVSSLDELVFGANRIAMLRWMWQGAPWVRVGCRTRWSGGRLHLRPSRARLRGSGPNRRGG